MVVKIGRVMQQQAVVSSVSNSPTKTKQKGEDGKELDDDEKKVRGAMMNQKRRADQNQNKKEQRKKGTDRQR